MNCPITSTVLPAIILTRLPLGQPILVGHHSQKRHRKDLNRIHEHFAKAKEHHDKPKDFRRRAAAAESNVIIFSDDPDATEKLVDKIERLKKRQGVMKRANHRIRKADREGLADLGFSEETIAKLFAQDFAGRAVAIVERNRGCDALFRSLAEPWADTATSTDPPHDCRPRRTDRRKARPYSAPAQRDRIEIVSDRILHQRLQVLPRPVDIQRFPC